MNFREKMRFFWDVYRRMDRKTRVAWSQLGPSSVFVDVGANLGVVSLAAIARGCVVHAIEPNPWALDSLRQVLGTGPRVNVYDFAASKTQGKVKLFLHQFHGDNPVLFSSGSSLLSSKPNVAEDGIEVEGRDFADFLASLGRVDFLKIDIEGYEVELIPHLVEALDWEQIGFIAVETHDKVKWKGILRETVAMKEVVSRAGLSAKFSWNWP